MANVLPAERRLEVLAALFSKFIIAWHVGKRDQESADALFEDVRARLVVMPQITTDGHGLYAQPIAANFGPAVSCAGCRICRGSCGARP